MKAQIFQKRNSARLSGFTKVRWYLVRVCVCARGALRPSVRFVANRRKLLKTKVMAALKGIKMKQDANAPVTEAGSAKAHTRARAPRTPRTYDQGSPLDHSLGRRKFILSLCLNQNDANITIIYKLKT